MIMTINNSHDDDEVQSDDYDDYDSDDDDDDDGSYIFAGEQRL